MAENAKHLLLVDDEAALREAIAERLADHGFVVEQAANGEDAVARPHVIREVGCSHPGQQRDHDGNEDHQRRPRQIDGSPPHR